MHHVRDLQPRSVRRRQSRRRGVTPAVELHPVFVLVAWRALRRRGRRPESRDGREVSVVVVGGGDRARGAVGGCAGAGSASAGRLRMGREGDLQRRAGVALVSLHGLTSLGRGRRQLCAEGDRRGTRGLDRRTSVRKRVRARQGRQGWAGVRIATLMVGIEDLDARPLR